MGRYIFSIYELVIVVVCFDYYVNLWYNKDVTKIGFLKKGGKNMKKLTIETKKRLLFCGAILLIISLFIAMACFLNKETVKEQEAYKYLLENGDLSPEQETYEYLLKNGDLSPEQAIGIVANIRQQSNFNTSVHEGEFQCHQFKKNTVIQI